MIILGHEPIQQESPVSIKVVGIGGAGGNTINYIIQSGCLGIEFIAVNTDIQALTLSKANQKIQIGVKLTKGQGSGANPEIGKRAIEEDLDKVMAAIGHADIVFLTAGLGGGTGTGVIPVLAKALREKNILSVAVVTKPFAFEGKRREAAADETIKHLKDVVDTLIVIPNQKLLDLVDQRVSMIDAFAIINNVLGQSVRGISEIITRPGHINVDYADVRTIMKDRGLAIMGTGRASGPNRAEEATLQAISSLLFENVNIHGARGVLLNITGGPNLSLHEMSHAASVIHDLAHEDANIILGSVIHEELHDEVIVTIIATGFEQKQSLKPAHGLQTELSNELHQITESKSIEKGAKEELFLKHSNDVGVQEAPLTVSTVSSSQSQGTKIIQESHSHIQKVESCQELTTAEMNDLDVPTFLRVKQKEEANSW